MKIYGVIMAGGGGTRFWPLSTKAVPKQFLNLSGKDNLLNETIDRQKNLIAMEDIFVVTNESQVPLVLEKTNGRIRKDHILAEPAARNTAACIGYAAMEIVRKYEDGVMCIFAADHHIMDEKAYTAVMQEAVRIVCEKDALVTVGIRPSYPATGYGYIRNVEIPGVSYRKVEEFVEKPDQETAAAYLESGAFAWNSGMFIWKASTILKYFCRLLPDIYGCLTKIGDAMLTPAEKDVIREIYPTIPKISVDYGIMERAEGVLMLEGDFGWSDVGSWDSLDSVRKRDAQGNITGGRTMLLDSADCVAYSQNRLIAAVGVKNLVIVETDRAVLVCPVDQAQRVKEIVEALPEHGLEEYL